MSIIIRWDDPTTKTILFYEFAHPWTWDDYYRIVAEADNILADIPHTVSVIHYATTPKVKLPPNMLFHLQRLLPLANPRVDRYIVVGAPTVLRSLLNAMRQIHGQTGYLNRVHLVRTLDEACAIAGK